MNIFNTIWTTWGNMEKGQMAILLLSILIFVPGIIKYITKNNSLTIFSVLSLISSGLVTVMALISLYYIFNITLDSVYLVTIVIVLFLNLLSISTLISYYQKHKFDKKFEIRHLHKEYLSDTTHQSATILISFAGISTIVPSELFILTTTTAIVSLISIWLNYPLIYRLVREND